MKLGEIDINIIKSKRKTISIYIERDGRVTARVPETITSKELHQDLHAKEYLIHKHLAEWTSLNESRVHREYVSGQSFMYLGRNYRLRLVDEPMDDVILKNGRFLMNRSQVSKADLLFKAFYKHKLTQKIFPIIHAYEQQMNLQAASIKVMELKGRWASCTPSGKLNFHWKCAMAPIDVLHYIVVHELAHLRIANHSKAFWNEVDKILPNYSNQKVWLQKHGAGMDL